VANLGGFAARIRLCAARPRKREARDRILRYIETGRHEGATLAYGGGVPAGPQFEPGFWVEPTIFTDVANGMTIAREEIFGPVLAVIRCESIDQAIRIANDTEYGLSAGLEH
jgi:acyl-CoA reductase-like NAD-dependent aldehyde dehydrogenase